jgi:hypothetical protein
MFFEPIFTYYWFLIKEWISNMHSFYIDMRVKILSFLQIMTFLGCFAALPGRAN